MAKHIVIVGGELAGLACAVALGDAGLRVTLVERAKRLGGRALSWTDPTSGDAIDLGPHIVHSEYRNMLAFLERLGTRELICWQPDKLITLLDKDGVMELKHRRLPPPLGLLPDLVARSGLALRELWSNNRATWRAMRFDEADVPELDRLSALEYLRAAGVSRPMIDWFWFFAALMRVHSQLIGHRGLHFGFPAVALSDLFAPQAQHAIVRNGGAVLLNSEVVNIDRGVILRDGARVAADHVVLAVPPQVEPSPYVSCYLWFDRKLTRGSTPASTIFPTSGVAGPSAPRSSPPTSSTATARTRCPTPRSSPPRSARSRLSFPRRCKRAWCMRW